MSFNVLSGLTAQPLAAHLVQGIIMVNRVNAAVTDVSTNGRTYTTMDMYHVSSLLNYALPSEGHRYHWNKWLCSNKAEKSSSFIEEDSVAGGSINYCDLSRKCK